MIYLPAENFLRSFLGFVKADFFVFFLRA